MIKAVLFDMDGTLIDSETVGLKAWQYVIDKNSLDIDLTLPYRSIGLNYKSMTELFYSELGRDFPFELYWKQAKEYFAQYADKYGIDVKDGFDELCAYLKSNRIGMYVATSTYHNSAIDTLEKCGIWKYFDGIVGGDEITNGKPNPEIFLKAAFLSGFAPDECLIVEDSENGVRAALASGIDCIFIKDRKDIPEELKEKLLRECSNLAQVAEVIDSAV